MTPDKNASAKLDVSSKTFKDGEVSIMVNIAHQELSLLGDFDTFAKDALEGVEDATLQFVGDVKDVLLLNKSTYPFELTVEGDLIRCFGVQNLIIATLRGKEEERLKLLRTVNAHE